MTDYMWRTPSMGGVTDSRTDETLALRDMEATRGKYGKQKWGLWKGCGSGPQGTKRTQKEAAHATGLAAAVAQVQDQRHNTHGVRFRLKARV